jgi:hypothetical protein
VAGYHFLNEGATEREMIPDPEIAEKVIGCLEDRKGGASNHDPAELPHRIVARLIRKSSWQQERPLSRNSTETFRTSSLFERQ